MVSPLTPIAWHSTDIPNATWDNRQTEYKWSENDNKDSPRRRTIDESGPTDIVYGIFRTKS